MWWGVMKRKIDSLQAVRALAFWGNLCLPFRDNHIFDRAMGSFGFPDSFGLFNGLFVLWYRQDQQHQLYRQCKIRDKQGQKNLSATHCDHVIGNAISDYWLHPRSRYGISRPCHKNNDKCAFASILVSKNWDFLFAERGFVVSLRISVPLYYVPVPSVPNKKI